MIDQDDEIADAVHILRAHGRALEPAGRDLAMWAVEGAKRTDAEVLALAAALGLTAGSEQLQ